MLGKTHIMMSLLLRRKKKLNEKISPANIDKDALNVIHRLNKSGYTAYLVGGGVRDILLGRTPKDFDIVTNARPRQIRQLFKNAFLIGRRFRLALIVFGDKQIETSTFRRAPNPNEDADQSAVGALYQDADNLFGTPEQDAQRRDFTVNALFYDVKTSSIIDYTGGMKDLENGVLRSIGDPNIRFREDPVRMLRAIRLSARLDFKIHSDSLKAIAKHGDEILQASKPRIFEETMRLFGFSKAEASFRKLWDSKLMARLLPEIEEYLKISGGKKSQLWNYLNAFDKLNNEYNTDDKQSRTYISDVALKMSTLIAPIFLSQISPTASIEERYELANQLIFKIFKSPFSTPAWNLPKLICFSVAEALVSFDFYKTKQLKRNKLYNKQAYPLIEALWKISATAREDEEALNEIEAWNNGFKKFVELNPIEPQHQAQRDEYEMFPHTSKAKNNNQPQQQQSVQGNDGEEAPIKKKKRRKRKKGNKNPNLNTNNPTTPVAGEEASVNVASPTPAQTQEAPATNKEA